MAKWSLAPIEGSTVEELKAALQQHVSDLSLIFGELEQIELQVKGQGGYTPTVSNTLDLQGNSVMNARPSRMDTEYITRKEAQDFSLYAKGGMHKARGRIQAMSGLTVTSAVAQDDALPLGQAEKMMAGAIPAGIITLWSGSATAVPTGWALCDGSSGTPDLRDRFLVGAGGAYAVGATGGAAALNLAHTHSDGTYATATPSATTTVDNNLALSTVAVASGTHTHDVTGASGTALSATQDIRPPFYSLAYIMKL